MARERYLLHAGEDTIHDPNAEKKAEKTVETPQGKWDNFWYYHKIHVLIGVFVLLIAGYFIWSAVRTVQPDYTIGMITRQNYPQEAISALENEMAKYGKDLNKDGKVVVQINQYTISSEKVQAANPQMDMAYQTKMTADITEGISMIFITDDESFRSQEQQGNHMFAYLDGSTPKDTATDYDKMRVSVPKCPKLANGSVNINLISGSKDIKLSALMKDLSLSMRVYYGSGIQGKQKDYYEASKALFQKLTT